MDRKEFIKGLEQRPVLSEEERKRIIKLGVSKQPWKLKCVIAMEEFAELQQEISKKIRGVEDDSFSDLGLLEEMADAYICLANLTEIFAFKEETIQFAINVKLQRERERLHEK